MISALLRSIRGACRCRCPPSTPALVARLASARQVGHALESGDVVGAAVRIAGVVYGIDSDEDVSTTQYLGPGQGQGEHDGVAGGNIGDRDARLNTLHRYGDPVVGEGGTAELGEIEFERALFDRTKSLGDVGGGRQLGTVALSVIERQAVGRESPLAGDGEAGGGIQTPGKKDDGFIWHGAGSLPDLLRYLLVPALQFAAFLPETAPF